MADILNSGDYFKVGIITSTHGVHGEVKVYPTTDDVKRFKRLKEVLMVNGKETRTLEIESVKFFKQMVILKFKGLDNMNDVEKFRQATLHVDRAHAVRLSRDEYFIADLIDLDVVDENQEKIGVLTDVLETGANDVYVITMPDGQEVLLPAIKQCILNVDMENRVMTVHILDGLLE